MYHDCTGDYIMRGDPGLLPSRFPNHAQIRKGTLQAIIEQYIQYIEHHNKDPKPFIWTASADDILAKVTRAKAALARAAR